MDILGNVRPYYSWLIAPAVVHTLYEVGSGTDWNYDIVEGRSVRRREMSVTALTLVYHIALVTRLFACL